MRVQMSVWRTRERLCPPVHSQPELHQPADRRLAETSRPSSSGRPRETHRAGHDFSMTRHRHQNFLTSLHFRKKPPIPPRASFALISNYQLPETCALDSPSSEYWCRSGQSTRAQLAYYECRTWRRGVIPRPRDGTNFDLTPSSLIAY